MKKTLKNILSYIAVFAATVVISAAVMVASAMIPKSALRDNMLSSADTLCENKVFFVLWDDVVASKIDRYADSILLNIAYHYDDTDPFRSVMTSEYYYTYYQDENDNLRESVRDELPANKQYLRYWHGMTVPIRIMHLFTDLNGIYIANGVIMVLLIGFLVFLLIKNRLYAGAVGILCSLAMVGVWFVPFSLEYTPTVIIMLVMSILSVILTLRRKTELLLKLFIADGVITCFFDFLTCETLTLVIPLLLTVYIGRVTSSGTAKKNALYSVKACILWGLSFVCMWAAKWIAAAAVLGEDVSPMVTNHITERLGASGKHSILDYIVRALWNNISCVFPLGLGTAGIVAAIVIVFATVGICVFLRKKGAQKPVIFLYAAIGAIPFIRYIVINNHSALHFFFTYRALAASIFAICLITAEIIGTGRFVHASSE